MTTALLRAAAGVVLIALPGWAALRSIPALRPATRSGELALALAVGFALAVPAALAVGLLGLPLSGATIASICLALALAIRLVATPETDRAARPLRGPRPISSAASCLLLAAVAVLFVAKIAVVPLWSWDYYAVHGVRARRIFSEETLRLENLRQPGLEMTHPDYLLGVPIGWRLLTLGTSPDARSVKIAHVVFALALLALVREAILAAGRSEAAANTGAAFVAISPLLWDTESLGLVEVPFALLLTAAICLFLKRSRDSGGRGGWIWGAAAGFLPWIKFREGLTLALFLSIAIVFSTRFGKKRGAIAAAILWAGAAAAISTLLLPPGERFLVGDWMSRGLSRLAHPRAVVGPLVRDLLAPEWFGFWIVFSAGWLYSIVKKRQTAALLTSVVAAQLATYASVYFVTYLDPAAHIRSSFFRITAALVPAAIVALAARVTSVGEMQAT